MPDVIKPLLAFIRLRKFVVNAVVPLGRLYEIIVEKIAAPDLEQRFGAFRALREIPEQGQEVLSGFNEVTVELKNPGAAQPIGFGQHARGGRVNPIEPDASAQ